MQGSVRSRKDDREGVPPSHTQKHGSLRRRAHSTPSRVSPAAPRLIGLPQAFSLPKLTGIRPRYCNHWDEEPAAILAQSLLRLNIAKASDFNGSAVDMVKRVFLRVCEENGAARIREEFCCHVSVCDLPVDASEYERNQNGCQVAEGDALFMSIEYSEARVIPLRAVLAQMEDEHELLPASFLIVFNHALSAVTRVYSVEDAEERAEIYMEDYDCPEEELDSDEKEERSLYQCFLDEMPTSVKKSVRTFISEGLKGGAIGLLQRFQKEAKSKTIRELLALVTEAYFISLPHRARTLLSEECNAFFSEAEHESALEGAVLCFDEHDETRAMFDEDSQNRAQGNYFMPWACYKLDMAAPDATLDAEVLSFMTFLRDILRTLSVCCGAVDIIWDEYERYRQDRKKRRVHA